MGFNLSTRESSSLRDRLIPLGVTMMSAGSSTRPGGYAHLDGDAALEQFEVEDRRSPAEVVAAIRHAGYDPVWRLRPCFCGIGAAALLVVQPYNRDSGVWRGNTGIRGDGCPEP